MVGKYLAILVAVFLSCALWVPSASATSAYDEAYRTTNVLRISAVGTNCPTLDLSNNWANVVLDESNWVGSAPSNGQTLQDAFDHGAWAVSKTTTQQESYISVFWTTTPTSLLWGTNLLVFASSFSAYQHQAIIREDGSCRPSIYNTAFPTLSTSENATTTLSVVNFLIAGDVDFNYPPSYEGADIRTTAPTSTYIAMGDSFSSGEGNEPFEEGTHTSGANECHRSPWAYPCLLDHDEDLGLGAMDFVACSGATTNDIRGISETNDPSGKWNEPTQLDAITADTDVITINVGGDDVGFKDYASACAWDCDPGTSAFQTIVDNINDPNSLDNLESTYEAILAEATNPNVQVYVVNYPYLAPQGAGTCAGFDASTAYSVENLLNSVISLAVTDVNDSRLHYVDTNTTGSPFAGKDLCGNDSDFNGMDLVNQEYSLHPNTRGQQDYATVVKDYILSH